MLPRIKSDGAQRQPWRRPANDPSSRTDMLLHAQHSRERFAEHFCDERSSRAAYSCSYYLLTSSTLFIYLSVEHGLHVHKNTLCAES